MSLGHGSSIVRDGLVLHLDAANLKSYSGSGTDCSDLVGNGIVAILENGTTFSQDSNGYFSFDGVNDSIATIESVETILPNSLFADSNNQFSVSAWFRWVENPTVSGATNHSHTIVSRGLGIATSGTFLLFGSINTYDNGLGALEFGKCFVNVRGVNSKVSDERIDNNKWYNVVVTWDGSVCRSYFNGSPSNDLGVGSASLQATARLKVGRAGLTTHYFQGNVSDVKIYNRAISSTEIKQNFEATRSRYGI